jgi:hypothetical protein
MEIKNDDLWRLLYADVIPDSELENIKSLNDTEQPAPVR